MRLIYLKVVSHIDGSKMTAYFVIFLVISGLMVCTALGVLLLIFTELSRKSASDSQYHDEKYKFLVKNTKNEKQENSG